MNVEANAAQQRETNVSSGVVGAIIETSGSGASDRSDPNALLEKLGLSTLAGVKVFRGELIKDHKGRRDIFRLCTAGADGVERTWFLKRCWKPYKKDGLASLLRRGRVWSISRQEWENSKALERAGLRAAGRVAFGEECGPLWEKFSFLVTEAAVGSQTVEQFLQTCAEPARRRKVFEALAAEIRKMHEAGLASPDLFTRHLFVDESEAGPRFCFIDMARLDCKRGLPDRLRARDLAALNLTAPLRFVSARERLRFLLVYARGSGRDLLPLIRRRVEYLLRRRKFRGFAQASPPAR